MYKLNPEQQTFIDKARDIADRVIGPNAAAVDREGRFPSESIAALGEAGLLGLTIPGEYGGSGQSPRVAAAVLDEIGQRCASTGMVYLMHLCGVACYIARPEHAGDQLRAAAQGQHLSTLAWSEKGSRSHFWAPVSQALRLESGVALSAEKSFVTSAGKADGYVVSVGAVDRESPLQSTLYLVLKGDEGMNVSGGWDSLGMRGNASAPMSLFAVKVDDSRLMSDEGKGFDAMLGVVLPMFQLGNAAISVGICEAACQSTVQHLTSGKLEHLGSSLADLPNLRARLARMRIETDKARAHLAASLDAIENPGPTTMLMVLESKTAASETALEVTDIGMRACGGAAFGKHLSIERNFRDARAASVMAPTTDVLHDFIGKALCGMELF
ncbi:MAG TPA: acyl-CoA dehydrogenase family protein [Fimbriimonas sp.]|nr:acyl-CoA dehydrogenase family protein [Fimbriimonas sp.]